MVETNLTSNRSLCDGGLQRGRMRTLGHEEISICEKMAEDSLVNIYVVATVIEGQESPKSGESLLAQLQETGKSRARRTRGPHSSAPERKRKGRERQSGCCCWASACLAWATASGGPMRCRLLRARWRGVRDGCMMGCYCASHSNSNRLLLRIQLLFENYLAK